MRLDSSIFISRKLIAYSCNICYFLCFPLLPVLSAQWFHVMVSATIEANRTMLATKFQMVNIPSARHRAIVTIQAATSTSTVPTSNARSYLRDHQLAAFVKKGRGSVAPDMNAVSTPFEWIVLTQVRNPTMLLTFHFLDKEKIAELSKTTCFVNGNQYVKGQVMYPDSHSCYTCICDSGFDNQTIVDSRHCKKVDCNVEFHYSDNIARGCIPIYYKDASCCPIGWRCRK